MKRPITIKEFVGKISEKFKERLEYKTGWGRTEVLYEFDKAVREVLLEMLEETELVEKSNG